MKPTISGMECTRQCGEGQRKASHYHFSCLHNITHKATYLSLHFVDILCTQSHFLMASFCSHSVHTKPLTYGFILFTFCAHKATSLWLHFVDILCTQSHLLSCYVVTQKAAYCHLTFSKTFTHKPFTITSLFLHANTHKGSYCD